MTWTPGPIGDDENPADLYAAVRALAVRSVDMLEEAADKALEEPTGDVFRLQLSADLRGLRDELIATCHLHKQLLTRGEVDELRKGFEFAGLAGPEHEAKRKEITEEVAEHPVARLAELTPEEAARLNTRLRDLEEKW